MSKVISYQRYQGMVFAKIELLGHSQEQGLVGKQLRTACLVWPKGNPLSTPSAPVHLLGARASHHCLHKCISSHVNWSRLPWSWPWGSSVATAAIITQCRHCWWKKAGSGSVSASMEELSEWEAWPANIGQEGIPA